MSETPVLLADGALMAIRTDPDTPGDPPRGAVWLNAGLVPRSGPARLHVELARRLARGRDGLASLRLDFSGVGDSAPRADALPFARSSVEETRAAMDHLAEARGCERFLLAGVCSGGLAAFRTALVDERVEALVLVNPPGLEDAIPDSVAVEVDRAFAADYYSGVATRRLGSWAKLLTGRADYRAIGASLRHRLSPTPAKPPAAAERVRADLFALDERGVRALHVYSRGDWGHGYLRWALGRDWDALTGAGRTRVEVLDGADHLVTPLAARARLVELVSELKREWA